MNFPKTPYSLIKEAKERLVQELAQERGYVQRQEVNLAEAKDQVATMERKLAEYEAWIAKEDAETPELCG